MWHILAEITVGAPSGPGWQKVELHLTTVARASCSAKRTSKLFKSAETWFGEVCWPGWPTRMANRGLWPGCIQRLWHCVQARGFQWHLLHSHPSKYSKASGRPSAGAAFSLPLSSFSEGHLDLHPARLKQDHMQEHTHVGVRRSRGTSHRNGS